MSSLIQYSKFKRFIQDRVAPLRMNEFKHPCSSVDFFVAFKFCLPEVLELLKAKTITIIIITIITITIILITITIILTIATIIISIIIIAIITYADPCEPSTFSVELEKLSLSVGHPQARRDKAREARPWEAPTNKQTLWVLPPPPSQKKKK